MAFYNLFLSVLAFLIGLIILIVYPIYFGIVSPIDVILTPIGLVFVLEMDNWLFQVSKHFYRESSMSVLWSFKSGQFEYYSFNAVSVEVTNSIFWIIAFLSGVTIITSTLLSVWNKPEEPNIGYYAVMVSAVIIGVLIVCGYVICCKQLPICLNRFNNIVVFCCNGSVQYDGSLPWDETEEDAKEQALEINISVNPNDDIKEESSEETASNAFERKAIRSRRGLGKMRQSLELSNRNIMIDTEHKESDISGFFVDKGGAKSSSKRPFPTTSTNPHELKDESIMNNMNDTMETLIDIDVNKNNGSIEKTIKNEATAEGNNVTFGDDTDIDAVDHLQEMESLLFSDSTAI